MFEAVQPNHHASSCVSNSTDCDLACIDTECSTQLALTIKTLHQLCNKCGNGPAIKQSTPAHSRSKETAHTCAIYPTRFTAFSSLTVFQFVTTQVLQEL